MLTNPLRFESFQDVQRKMSSTILKYRDKFYWSEYREGLNLTLLRPTSHERGEPFPVHSSDTELCTTAPQLGYANLKSQNGPLYIVRVPVRRNTFGINGNNCKGVKGLEEVNLSQRDILSEEFFQMLEKKYKSFEESLEFVTKSNSTFGMGFDAKLCLIKDDLGFIKIQHFNTTIGLYDPRKRMFLVPERTKRFMPILKMLNVPSELI